MTSVLREDRSLARFCGEPAAYGESWCARAGSVRARASQYRLTWNEANPGSCGLQDGQHCHTPPEKEESLAVGGHMLMVAGARAEDVAQFFVRPAEPSGRSGAIEPRMER